MTHDLRWQGNARGFTALALAAAGAAAVAHCEADQTAHGSLPAGKVGSPCCK